MYHIIKKGDSLDLILAETIIPDLVVTDPPYAFGGSGNEHALSATVAVVLRETAVRLAKGRETQEPHGSFEIFWHDGTGEPGSARSDDEEDFEPQPAGWYWWACFPGCMPDGEPSGPFATSRDALQDADEWHPEFDE